MRRFFLRRIEDETGMSGTGNVAWGVLFPDGTVVTRWCVTDVRQTCVWSSIDDVRFVHGHGGKTEVVFLDDGPGGGSGPNHDEAVVERVAQAVALHWMTRILVVVDTDARARATREAILHRTKPFELTVASLNSNTLGLRVDLLIFDTGDLDDKQSQQLCRVHRTRCAPNGTIVEHARSR